MDGGESSCRESSNLRAKSGRAPHAVSVLEADGAEPAGYGECGDTLDEGVVESEQDVFANSKGVKFP